MAEITQAESNTCICLAVIESCHGAKWLMEAHNSQIAVFILAVNNRYDPACVISPAFRRLEVVSQEGWPTKCNSAAMKPHLVHSELKQPLKSSHFAQI